MNDKSYLAEQSIAFDVARLIRDVKESGLVVFVFNEDSRRALGKWGIPSGMVIVLHADEYAKFAELIRLVEIDESKAETLYMELIARQKYGPFLEVKG